jgi:hypothetical protein
MRANALTKCAVGAMLFGGTLGAGQAAQASVTNPGTLRWLAGDNYYDPNSYGYNASSFLQVTDSSFNSLAVLTTPTSGFPTDFGNLPSASISTASPFPASSVLFSGTTDVLGAGPAVGFSFSATSSAGLNVFGKIRAQGFVVAGGPVEISLFLASNPGAYGDSGFSILDITSGAPGQSVASLSSAGTATFTLGPGTYLLNGEWNVSNAFSGTFMSFSVVPAPGAIALLGAAGLVGGTRRRR